MWIEPMEVSFLWLRIGRELRSGGVGVPNVKYLFRQNEITPKVFPFHTSVGWWT